MFDRFIRLSKARRALRDQRYADAVALAQDPLIAGDRRAEQIRRAARQQLLARARQRLLAGDLAAARADGQRLRAAGDDSAVAALFADLDAAAAAVAAALAAREQALAAARQAVDAGEPTRAEGLLAEGSVPADAERRLLERRIEERRRQAGLAAEQGVEALARGDLATAAERAARAELLDRDHAAVLQLRTDLGIAAGAALGGEVQRRLAAGDPVAALQHWRAATAALPAAVASPAGAGAGAALAAAALAHARQLEDLAAAGAFARAVRDAGLPIDGPFAILVDALLAIAPLEPGAEASQDAGRLAAAVAAAAREAGAPALAAAAEAFGEQAAATERPLALARQRIERGELDTARALLVEFAAAHPRHAGARRELDLVDQGLADLDRRLADVREALRAGRLRHVCTQALALAGSARVAAAAQPLVAEARARMALVDRGLDEVRVALHGRAAATLEGVRHCLLRLEELAKVQVDHEELPQVVAAVRSEIEALAAWERAVAAVERRQLAEALAVVPELLERRSQLLAPDRLTARLCDLADRLARLVDVALASGRLGEVEACAARFDSLAAVRPEFGAQAAAWRAAIGHRRDLAASLLAEARTRLQQRDLADAERLLEQAQVQWQEDPEARAFQAELRQLRLQSDALDRAAVLAQERDFAGAQQKLAALAGTAPLLRTRIYDMKQNLARAQGLEGAFLLRVDEGGEQLVLRGESVSIGNVRQARADLPVLANLSGRHATIRRSMSFHGGMQDTIVAEEGEVRVGGQKVAERPLAPGDRVQLGPALGFVYQRPTPRSLTVGLLLQSGFQVAGTDRVLLMKDRGRDGRILLGPGPDVHVRVASATGEVEVYATNTGQIRVGCAAGGTIDGVPFRGEHPVAAGQLVAAAGVSFVLLPWRPAA